MPIEMIEQFFIIFLVILFFHSTEEHLTGFHKKSPLYKMSFPVFFGLEAIFFGFWLIVFLTDFQARTGFMAFFNILMFINGIWHILWFMFLEKGKRYVPGLITAPLFVITFVVFYINLLIK